MRNLKKFLAVLVVVAMMATTMMTTVFAASPTPAEKATGLGFLKGGSAGVNAAYLAIPTQRIQAAIIQLRLIGKEAEARAYTATTANFEDANLVADVDGAVNILAYLKATPALGWVGFNNKFGPNELITSQQLYKVFLTTLGYAQGSDFEFGETFGFARAKGLTLLSTIKSVNNGVLAFGLIEVLGASPKGVTTKLLDKLIASGVITVANATIWMGYKAPVVQQYVVGT